MASLQTTPPLTPLDALRTLLLGFNEGQDAFSSNLVNHVQRLRRASLKVLQQVLLDVSRPRALKRAILALPTRFDWPGWVPILEAFLAQERDLGLFDEGAAALGGLGLRTAREALQRLTVTCPEPDRKVILDRELALFAPQQGFSHYLARLQEGQSNLRLAHQGAKHLAVLATPENLPVLVETLVSGDALAQRLCLKVIASLPAPRAIQALLQHLERLRTEHQDQVALQDLIHRTGALPRHTARETFFARVEERLGARDPLAMTRLKSAMGTDEPGLGAFLEPLGVHAQGALDTFLLEALALLLESKVARFSAYHAEVGAASTERLMRIQEQAEYVAELLADAVESRQAAAEEVVPALRDAFQARLGQDGLLQAYLQLLPVDDVAALDALRAEPDPALRQKYLDALGAREENALAPFFLQAMQDPIVEVGQRAIHHLGRLPDAFPVLMDMFQSGQVERVRQAIRVFGENRTEQAAEPLVDFIRQDSRDDLLVEAVDALAEIRYAPATPVLLNLLHDGKPLTLQKALTRALTLLGSPDASLGLLARAPSLKQAAVLIRILEGALQAFGDFQHPLPSPELPSFMALFKRCSDAREGEGQRVPAMLACEGLYVFDRDAYLQLKDRFSDLLSELRLQDSWDREMNDRVGALVKEMGRRADLLGSLSRQEGELRACIQQLPPAGPARLDSLLGLRDALSAPERLLRPEMARELADFVLKGLGQPKVEWRETAHLCEIGGLTGCPEVVDPIRAIYQRATGLGLRSASQKALQRLGLSPEAMDRRRPVRSILVLEPSAFFRRRLTTLLAQEAGWTVREAGTRLEAEAALGAEGVDALVTEHQDSEGNLHDWVDSCWQKGRCDRVVLSTADRAAREAWQGPMLAGSLFKPYPPELLVDMLRT